MQVHCSSGRLGEKVRCSTSTIVLPKRNNGTGYTSGCAKNSTTTGCKGASQSQNSDRMGEQCKTQQQILYEKKLIKNSTGSRDRPHSRLTAAHPL